MYLISIESHFDPLYFLLFPGYQNRAHGHHHYGGNGGNGGRGGGGACGNPNVSPPACPYVCQGGNPVCKYEHETVLKGANYVSEEAAYPGMKGPGYNGGGYGGPKGPGYNGGGGGWPKGPGYQGEDGGYGGNGGGGGGMLCLYLLSMLVHVSHISDRISYINPLYLSFL